MSKTLNFIYVFVLLFMFASFTPNIVRAATFDVKITLSGTTARVEGKNDGRGQSFLAFPTSYAGVNGLATRISDVVMRDADGRAVTVENPEAGVFVGSRPFVEWSYRVALTPPSPSAAAHVSWLGADGGLIVGGDLLPQTDEKTTARIAFAMPPEWRAVSVEKRLAGEVFETTNVDRAIFAVGRGFRETTIDAPTARINLVISGEFQVSDADAATTAREIFDHYAQRFGGTPAARAQIYLGRFPGDVKTGRWEAETRGSNVTILSSELSFKTQSEQRLHEQFRHEIFHLWFPNGVNFGGNYDWFYEGFALYESLRTALALRRIRFEDFLDTLGRAHAVDSLMTARGSLLDSSTNRWAGANTQVYARGMLVAFLADVVILRDSKGRDSLEKLLGELYRKHRFPAPRTDGNAAVIAALNAREGVKPIVERYVRGKAAVEWQAELDAAGIESRSENASTKLSVRPNLNGRQKDLLDKLGYNDWRKKSD